MDENNNVTNVKDREAAVSSARELPKWLDYVGQALLLITALYHLYAAGYKPLPGLQHTAVHLGLGIAVIMLYFPISKRMEHSKVWLAIDTCLAVLSLINMVFVSAQYETYNQRIGLAPRTIDMVLGITTVVILFIAARRTLGWAFPIIAGVFVAYMFLGPMLPKPWFHTGTTIHKFVSDFYLTMNGIYGSITRTSADVIVLFILFSSLVKNSPIGDFIMDLATSIFGSFRGGPAKVACVSSGMMGMLSGSAVANVAGTGCITIPMMKKNGYPPEFAGAVEAAASTGGQIMPPVMGGSVFIMIELLSLTYKDVIVIAFPIAILYYIGLLVSIDLKAISLNLYGIPKEEKPKVGKVLKEGWYLAAPVIVLVVMLMIGYTAQRSGFFAIVAAIIVSFISPKERMTVQKLIKALQDGVKDAAVIFAVVGLASLISGIVTKSGLGLRLSSILVSTANGHILLLLILTAVASIILGMGLPVIVCYTFLALLIAPGMVELGIPRLAAHMFIFYYGCLSCITPPVALASIVAAGIAKSAPMKTGVEACKVAFPIFFIPFFFIYQPAILMQDGFTTSVLIAYIGAFIGLYASASGFVGAMLPKINFTNNMPLRIALVVLGIIILVPVGRTDLIGSAIFIAICAVMILKNRKPSAVVA